MTAPEDQNGLREALDAETIELAVERVICLVEAFTRAQEKEWESQTPRIWDRQVAAQDRLSLLINAVVNRALAAEAEITRLKEGMEALGAALEPFAAFAEHMIDEHGWLDREHRASISTWFGPSQFRRAHQAFATLSPKEQPHG